MTPHEAQSAAASILSHYYGPQLKVLATEGYCWFDLLLPELFVIADHSEPARLLIEFAKTEMKTEEWRFIKNLASFGRQLIEIENTARLLPTDFIGRAVE
ncbi:MAG: hypothetical protein ABFC56_12410 [Clostridiaceae bacterium]